VYTHDDDILNVGVVYTHDDDILIVGVVYTHDDDILNWFHCYCCFCLLQLYRDYQIWQEGKDNYYEETYEANSMGRCLEILTLKVGINTGQCQQIICKNAPDIFL
jgi:hypothetical protein